jgi:long-chain acyl-CoA synthetase
MLERVQLLACGLARLGVQPKDRVGVWGENRPEWAISYIGILTCGATVVPLDALLKGREIRHILEDSETKVVIVSGKFVPDILEVVDTVAGIGQVVSMDDDVTYDRVLKWSQIIEDGRAHKQSFPKPSLEDLAALIYTSGTTGKSKGVMLSQRNIMADVSSSYQVIHYDETDNFVSVLPLHHTFECTGGFLVPIYGGATITYARSLKSRDIIEDIKQTKATVMLGVPLLFEKMYQGVMRAIAKKPLVTRVLFRTSLGIVKSARALFKARIGGKVFHGLREKAGLSSLRLMVSGGAPLPPYIAEGFNELGFHLFQGYGLTETSPVLTVNPEHRPIHASVGQAIPGVELKIIDPDENGIGEIAARGDVVMMGYYNNPQATNEVFRDGWLLTGDSGRIDEEGYLYITGRLKNVIVTPAGKNIYPEEVEEVLNQSPYILESLVFGETVRNGQGEDVHAVIVPDYEYFDGVAEERGKEFSSREIEETIRGEVVRLCKTCADYKRVKDFQIREEEFEKTSTKKIKRFLFQQKPVRVEE